MCVGYMQIQSSLGICLGLVPGFWYPQGILDPIPRGHQGTTVF